MRFLAAGFSKIAVLLAFILAPMASASDDAPIRYTVRKGDNLITIGERYLHNSQSYKIVQRHNRISNPHAIPIGKILVISRSLLKYRPANAKLISVRGQVLANSASASVGQVLPEGTNISTGPSSFVTMLLDDGSRISLPSNSNVRISRLRSYVLGGSLDYDFNIAKGGVRSSVVKQKSGDDRYQVRTPKAVSAVRGTDFQSRYDPDNGSDYAEVVEGALAVEAGSSKTRSLPAGNGLAVRKGGGVVTEALLPPPSINEPGKPQAKKIVRFATDNPGGVRYTIATDAGFIEQVADTIAIAVAIAAHEDFSEGALVPALGQGAGRTAHRHRGHSPL